MIEENALTQVQPKSVGKANQRKYTLDIGKLTLRRALMSKQAKTLTAQELRRALDYVATRRHAARNRAMLMTMYLAGLRVGECAALRYEDILDAEGSVRSEIRLDAEQTKGRYGRVVFVSDKLRKELQAYVRDVPYKSVADKLFYTQKKNADGFTANTLCQFFHYLFRSCGVEGATSHSPRRTFITNLADKGVSVRVLQSLAGHRNISTTQTYIDVNDAMKRKAVELV
jgi:integrase/recombinase XerD